jgi:hypothetical protein
VWETGEGQRGQRGSQGREVRVVKLVTRDQGTVSHCSLSLASETCLRASSCTRIFARIQPSHRWRWILQRGGGTAKRAFTTVKGKSPPWDPRQSTHVRWRMRHRQRGHHHQCSSILVFKIRTRSRSEPREQQLTPRKLWWSRSIQDQQIRTPSSVIKGRQGDLWG